MSLWRDFRDFWTTQPIGMVEAATQAAMAGPSFHQELVPLVEKHGLASNVDSHVVASAMLKAAVAIGVAVRENDARRVAEAEEMQRRHEAQAFRPGGVYPVDYPGGLPPGWSGPFPRG